MLVLATVMFWIGKGQTPSPDTYINEVATWKKTAEAASQELELAQAKMKEMQRINAKLDSTKVTLTVRSEKLKSKIDATQQKLDITRDSLKALGADTSYRELWDLSEGYRHNADSLRVVVAVTEEIVVNREVKIANLEDNLKKISEKADSLQKRLLEAPTPPKPTKLLWVIPAPNRVTSFLIGAVGGTIAAIAVMK
jgi:chromosome segregation ATPase